MENNNKLTATAVVTLVCLAIPNLASSQEVLEDVALILRAKEVLAFSSTGNQWVVETLRAQEQVVESRADGQVAVVVTNQRALGFSSPTNQWREMRLEVGEELAALKAKGLVVSVDTNLRALGFGARQGRWMEFRYRSR